MSLRRKTEIYKISSEKGDRSTNMAEVKETRHRSFAFALVVYACMHAKVLQSCPTLCDPMDCSLTGSLVHGILQARILE